MKLPRITGKQLSRLVEKIGFKFHHQVGSHMTCKHLDGRKITIPNHGKEKLGPGLLNKIIKKDLRLTRLEFISLLRKK